MLTVCWIRVVDPCSISDQRCHQPKTALQPELPPLHPNGSPTALGSPVRVTKLDPRLPLPFAGHSSPWTIVLPLQFMNGSNSMSRVNRQ